MGTIKHIPELVMVNRTWRLADFQPGRPAHMYEEYFGKTGIIYVMACNEFHKIGLALDFEKRLKMLDGATPYSVKRVMIRRVPRAGLAYAEAWIHKQLANKLVKNEWFAVDRDTAVGMLKRGVIAAEVYDQYCRDWFNQDQEWRSRPEVKAKLDLKRYGGGTACSIVGG